MTIKIKSAPYADYAVGATVTLDDATEVALVAADRATRINEDETVSLGATTRQDASRLRNLTLPRPRPTGRVCLFGDSLALQNNYYSTPTAIVRQNNVATVSATFAIASDALFKLSGNVPASFNTNRTQIVRQGSSSFSYPSVGPNEAATAYGSVVALSWLSNTGQFVYANGALNGALELVYNFGVGGQRSDQVADRIQEVVAVGPTGTAECDEVWVIVGTNDALQSIPAATTTANYEVIARALVAAGYAVRFMTVPPFGPALSGLAAAMALVVQYNTWILSNAKAIGYIAVDVFAAMTDGTSANGAALTNYTQSVDNTHATQIGARAAGLKIAASYSSDVAVTASVLTRSQNDGYATSPLLPNIWTAAPWANTGGTISDVVSGTAASGFNVSSSGNAGRTAVASVVAANTGLGYAQQLVFTPAANGDTCTIQQNSGAVMSARVLPGERYQFKFYLKLTGVSGANLLYIRNRIQGTFGGVASMQIGSAITNQVQAVSYTDDLTMVCKSPPFVIPSGACSVMTSEIIFGFGAVGTALTIQIERVSMDRVV